MQLLKGETLTIGITLDGYDKSRIVEMKLYLGSDEYDIEADGDTLVSRLSSEQTDAKGAGRHKVALWLNDTILGVKKHPLGEIEILKTGALKNNESVNTLYDIVYNLSINEETISVDSVLYNYFKGDTGDVYASTFEINPLTGILTMTYNPEFDATNFALQNGHLMFSIN